MYSAYNKKALQTLSLRYTKQQTNNNAPKAAKAKPQTIAPPPQEIVKLQVRSHLLSPSNVHSHWPCQRLCL